MFAGMRERGYGGTRYLKYINYFIKKMNKCRKDFKKVKMGERTILQLVGPCEILSHGQKLQHSKYNKIQISFTLTVTSSSVKSLS